MAVRRSTLWSTRKHFMRKQFSQKVPENGNYTFYVACDDACQLWLHMPQVNNLVDENDEETGKKRLAELKSGYWTDYNQWNK